MDTTNPQSCREVLLALGNGLDKTLTAEQMSTCTRIGNFITNHPRVGLWVQDLILLRYEHATRTIIAGAVDWKSIIAWLVANMGAILPLVLQIIALFGG